MPRRIAKFASAAFAIALAGIPLATMTRGETATVDGCLSAPNAETPPGGHWRYRIDHVNKRNCWYLRTEGGLSQAAPQNTSPAPSAPSAKPSVADAHAELRAQASREGGTAVSSPAAASPPANTQRSTPWPANPPADTATATVAPRWPDPVVTNPVSNGGPGTTNPADNPPQASTNLPTAAAASALADPPAPLQPVGIRALIAAVIGALALVGAATTLKSRRNRVRLPRHRKMSRTRGPIWETTDDDRIVIEDQPPAQTRNYEPRFARGVGSAKVQAAKVQAAKIQGVKVQGAKVQATKVRGDRRTEFPPRMPRSASR